MAKSVSCGLGHTVIIDMNNEVWSFGDSRYGQLGVDYMGRGNTPTKINGNSGAVFLPLAKFVSCGDEYTVIIAGI